MKYLIYLILFTILSLSVAVEAVAKFSYFTDFSDDISPDGSFEHGNWQVSSGHVEVVPDQEAQGGYLVKIPASNSPAMLQKVLEPVLEMEVLFIDFFIQPAAGWNYFDGTNIRANEAGIAFRQTSDGEASLFVRDRASMEWQDSFYTFDVDSRGGATDLQRITLRLDRTLGVYDLYVDGRMIDHDISMGDKKPTETVGFRIFGGVNASTLLDDFYAGGSNPLFEGASGIPFDWLESLGLDPKSTSRYDTVAENDSTLIEQYFSSLHSDLDDRTTSMVQTSENESQKSGLVVFSRLENSRDPFSPFEGD